MSRAGYGAGAGYGTLRAFGAGLTALMVAGSVVSATPALVRSTELVELAWPEGSTGLRLTPGPGTVTIREGSTPGIEIEQTTSFTDPQARVTEAADGTTVLDLSCPQGVLKRCHADWSIVVPEGASLDLTEVIGDVRLEEVTGPVAVSGSVGDVSLTGSPSTVDVRLSVGNLDVELSAPASEVTVQTNVGDVELRLPGEVAYDVRTRSDVAAEVVEVARDADSPYRVDVSTNVGDIRITND